MHLPQNDGEERRKTASSCQTENSASEAKQESNHLVELPVLSQRKTTEAVELFQDQNDIYGKFFSQSDDILLGKNRERISIIRRADGRKNSMNWDALS